MLLLEHGLVLALHSDMDVTRLSEDAAKCLLIENLNTAVLLFDDRLRLKYMNPAAEMLFGLSNRQVLGLSPEDLVPKGDVVHTHLHSALNTGHPFTEREMSLRVPNGTRITVDCTVTPIIDRAGAHAVLVELLRVDRLLRISREEALLAQSQVTRSLVRGLAHEIKNPLGGIRGAAQLLERELPEDDLTEYTGIIIGEADRLRNLVNKMLGPNSVPHKTEINIHEVLERVRSLVMAEAGDGLRIVRDYDPSLPALQADVDQLIQAVLNIVRNAVRAMNGEGQIVLKTRVEREFTVGSHRHRLVARLEIIDDGPGIPEDIRESIFYPMVSGDARGAGLGLSIAQSLINQHGGLIECQSQPGATVFTILIPYGDTE